MIGRFATGTNGFGRPDVSGRSLDPSPPAITTARIVRRLLGRRDSQPKTVGSFRKKTSLFWSSALRRRVGVRRIGTILRMAGTLILLCGLPGAGKTTLAKIIEADRNAIRMCPDEWIEAILADPADVTERDRLRDPIENLQWDLTQNYLRQGRTIVLENGFWAEEERTAYAVEALALGASIELYHLDIPRDKLWRRVTVRNQQLTRQTFVMTREEVEAGWAVFQPPTKEELAFYDEAAVVTAES